MHVAVFKYNKRFATLYSNLLFLFPPWLVLQNFGVWFDIYMKRENLSDGGQDKITWKRIRYLLTRRSDNVTLRRGGDVPQRRYWVLHLELTGGVVDTYHRRLGDVPASRHWVFDLRLAWDVVKTFWWDVVVTSSWDVVTTFQ